MKLSKFILTAIISTLFVSCGSKWITDYETAVKTAQKKNREILLVFSGDDWTEDSIPFKENLLNTKEFINKYSSQYVLCNVDFSQTEYARRNVAEDASDKEKKEAEKIAAEYAAKEILCRYYNVKKWPAVFITTYEGYWLAEVPFDSGKDLSATLEEYSQKISEAASSCDELRDYVSKVRQTSGLEKAKAIDDLVVNSNPKYSDLYKNLIYEFPEYDPENVTGRLGFYELAAAYYRSYEALAEKKSPDVPFIEVTEKGHLSQDQIQEAWFMAAYTLVTQEQYDSDKVLEYLEKAYNANSEGPNAGKILQNLQQMKKFIEMKNEELENAK